MARFRLFACAMAFVFALAGCGDAYSGLSSSSGVETVGDLAAAVAHRPTGTQYAAAAIGAVDTLGAVLGRVNAVAQRPESAPVFRQSFAGMGAGVPALGIAIGWQGTTYGRLSQGNSSGIIAASATSSGGTFIGSSASHFRISIRAAYRNGRLTSLNASRATFGGYTMFLASSRPGNATRIVGIVNDGRTKIATLWSDALGNGSLTITSTGAEYRLADWSVSG